jgi:CRP/FNR family transcriptional regulator, anaerobic regulatory protein
VSTDPDGGDIVSGQDVVGSSGRGPQVSWVWGHAMDRRRPVVLERLTSEGRVHFDRVVQRYCFEKGQMPILKGEEIKGAYIVDSGRLRVAAFAADGREATLYTLVAGETCILAINSLFNALPYPGNVIAEEDTRVLFVPGEAWRTLFRTEPEIQDLTLAALSVAVMRLMSELENLHVRPLRARLADLLLARIRDNGLVRMTQAQIACELGTAREVVARHLGQLRRQGVIGGARGQILVLDHANLAGLTEP